MNLELVKIKRTVYVVAALLIVAVGVLVWFLTRSFATLNISPRNSSFWLDGKEFKVVAGEVKINTSIGDHNIRVEADGYVGQNLTQNFGRGFNKNINITLSTTPTPTVVSSNSTLLSKGTDFNDGYYISANAIFKTKIGLDDRGTISVTENRAITDTKIVGVSEIVWSPTKDLALLRRANGISIFDFMKYDFIHQTDLPWGGSDIGSIAWSPDDSKIAYSYAPASGEKSLVFANITNTSIERILNFNDLGIENPILRWAPDSASLLIIPRNHDAAKNKIYLLNTYSRTLKTLVDSGNQLDAVFSPDSNKIIFSTKSAGSLPDLSVINRNGDNKKSLEIQADLAKTTWTKDSNNIIIATSDNATSTVSEYSVNKMTPVGFKIPDIKAKIDSIVVSDDNKVLIYEANGKIYAIKIGD